MYLQVLCTCVASLSLQRVELLFDFEVDNWLVRFLKHNILLGRGSLVGGWRSHRSFASYLRNELYIINEMSFFFLFLFQLYFWTRLPRLRWNGHDIRLVRKQLRLGWVDFSNSYKIFVSNNIHSGLSESVRLYMKGQVTIDIRWSSWLNVWRKIIQNRYYSGIHLGECSTLTKNGLVNVRNSNLVFKIQWKKLCFYELL